MTDLAQHIQLTPIVDTHEHQSREEDWLKQKPNVLVDIFTNYLTSDLVTAGMPGQAQEAINDADNPDIAGRFALFRKHWEAVMHTGYGEGARLVGRIFYGLDEFTPENLALAQRQTAASYHQPGERLRILREVGNIDHAQVDDFSFSRYPDPTDPEFFLCDLTWAGFSTGCCDPGQLEHETGVTVKDIGTYRQALETLFERCAPTCIAVKSQHAYSRTLRWENRSDDEADAALQTVLKLKEGESDAQAQLCLGDWALAQACRLAPEYNLPVKIHTGYLAGNSRMVSDNTRAGHLCPLLAQFPDTSFDLFHISYMYSDEVVGIAKHYPNVWIDMCWAWQMDPFSSAHFVRQMIHAVPANKLFAFGGDTGNPLAGAAYAALCRKYLTWALQCEVDDGFLSEAQAMRYASRIMRENQYELFDVDGCRQALREKVASPA